MTHEELEAQLRKQLARREPPAGFAERVVAQVTPKPAAAKPPSGGTWRRPLAIAAMLAVMVGGGLEWRRQREEESERQRRGEEAKRQLFLALKITSDKLGVVQTALDRSTH